MSEKIEADLERGKPDEDKNHIKITVLGQEGDEETVKINPQESCTKLLHKGLHALYGEPGPDPKEYDLVYLGKIIEPLAMSIVEADIKDKTTVSILPKSISRG